MSSLQLGQSEDRAKDNLSVPLDSKELRKIIAPPGYSPTILKPKPKKAPPPPAAKSEELRAKFSNGGAKAATGPSSLNSNVNIASPAAAVVIGSTPSSISSIPLSAAPINVTSMLANLPQFTQANVLYQLTPANNAGESNQESVLQGFILNPSEKNLLLVPDNSKTAVTSTATTITITTATSTSQPTFLIQKGSLPGLQNGNASGKPPVQNIRVTTALTNLANTNISNFTISKGAIKTKPETTSGNPVTPWPGSKGSFIRMPVASLQGKVLHCTSTTVSINSTLPSPKQLAAAPPKSVTASTNALLSLSSHKPSGPNQSVVRLAVRNGKLVPDANATNSPMVMTSKKVSIADTVKVAPPPIQSQQQTVHLSTPKQQINLSTIASVVPLLDSKFKLKGTNFSPLFFKCGTEADQTIQNANDPPTNPQSSENPSNEQRTQAMPTSSSTSNGLSEPATTSIAPTNSTVLNSGVYPVAMLSSDTTTTSAILSAISSSTVPVLHIPESLESQNGQPPIAPKPSGSLYVIPGIVPSNLSALSSGGAFYIDPSGAFITSLSTITDPVSISNVLSCPQVLSLDPSTTSSTIPVSSLPTAQTDSSVSVASTFPFLFGSTVAPSSSATPTSTVDTSSSVPEKTDDPPSPSSSTVSLTDSQKAIDETEHLSKEEEDKNSNKETDPSKTGESKKVEKDASKEVEKNPSKECENSNEEMENLSKEVESNLSIEEVEKILGIVVENDLSKEVEKNLSKEGEKNPSEEAEKNPSKEVEKNLSKEAEKNPSKEAEKNPSPEVEKNPSPEVEKNPSQEVEKNPSLEAEKNPSPEAEKNPSPEVEKNPSLEVEKDPSQEVEKNPSQEVEKNPSQEVGRNPSQEIEKSPCSLSESPLTPSGDDPKKLLDWTDSGTGALAGSSIKFRVNEFGMMEIDDGDKNSDISSDTTSLKDLNMDDLTTNKENFSDFLLCKENVLDDQENSKENRHSNSSIKKSKRKEKREIRLDDSDSVGEVNKTFEDKFDEMFNEKINSFKKAKLDTGESRKSIHKHKDDPKKEEIFQCKGCKCYGLSNEFFSERACSADCERDLKQKLVMAKKREFDGDDVKRKKKDQYFSLLKKEQDPKSDGKEDIPSKNKDTEEMEVEDKLETMSLEDEPNSSNSSQIPSRSKSPAISDFNDDSNFDVLSVGSDKSLSLPRPSSPITAPLTIFRSIETIKTDSYHTTKITNPFKVGMKLEGIDPQHQSHFCVMTVADVKGYRVRLHFDGYSECHDFWINANSPDIFPVGWCESKKRTLNPPLGYSKESFNWQSYLKQCRAKAAPYACFRTPPIRLRSNKVANLFKKGMKLEAVDRKNSSLTCVATVADTIDDRILVHFDSWGDVYDYWTDATAPYIHPVGWCQEKNCDLTPPTNYKSNKVFVWDEYLKDTKSTAVPARAFKPRENMFKTGMKLEAVDFRVPSLIRPATVIDDKDHQVRIAYDGFPPAFSFWTDCDNPNIYPLGWCEKTHHPLEPPASMDDVGDCGVRGCKGLGHVKGPKFVRHFSSQFCPYARQNLDLDSEEHIPDRLQAEPDTIEVDEPTSKPSVVRKELLETLETTSKPTQPEPPGPEPPEKLRKLSVDSASRDSTSFKPSDLTKKKGRKGKFMKEMESIGHDAYDLIRQEVIESVLRPGYVPSGVDLHAWTKHSDQLGISVMDADPRKWTHRQVTAFVTRIYNQPEKAQIFSEQEIDGEAFLMLSQKDLVDLLGLKLGPAIKIFNAIVLLRQKIS